MVWLEKWYKDASVIEQYLQGLRKLGNPTLFAFQREVGFVAEADEDVMDEAWRVGHTPAPCSPQPRALGDTVTPWVVGQRFARSNLREILFLRRYHFLVRKSIGKRRSK
jgi:hypothetical protein